MTNDKKKDRFDTEDYVTTLGEIKHNFLLFAPGNMAANTTAEPKILNINVGVLGHVDSGKTSLGETILDSAHFRYLPKPFEIMRMAMTM